MTARMLIAGLALFALAGCVKKEDPWADWPMEEPGEPWVEETCTPAADDTFCAEYASRWCGAHMGCCMDESLRFPSLDACVQRTTCICTGYRAGAAFEDGRIAFDDAAATALLDRLSTMAGTCAPVASEELDVSTVFHGSLAPGSDCSPVDTDYSTIFACAAGSYCAITDLGGDTTGVCRAFATEGASCDEAECAPGFFCEENPADLTTACRALRDAGAACDFDFQCFSDVCTETGTCDALDAGDTYCVGDLDDDAV